MPYGIVVVGTSTGGLKALQTLLGGLPEDFPLPIAIVQHRGKDRESGLCDYLRRHSHLPITEPEDKEEIVPGHTYLAPRDYHLLIENRSFALSIDPPVIHARPSIDVLFESAADHYQNQTIGVILTGGSYDGAQGLAKIKKQGGIALVEDPESAACREMPRAALDRAAVDKVLPLDEIAPYLQALARPAVMSHGI